MSEAWADGGAAAHQAPAVQDGITAGGLLRQAREAAGLHVAALAVSLKVPVRKLEALEDNRWDLLPDLVFVRALASSVCRTLKIDPQPILDRLPQVGTPRLARAADGINTPFRSPRDGAPPNWLDQLGKPVFLAVFALLLAALVILLLPRAQQEEPTLASAPQAPPVPQPLIIPAAVSTTEPTPAAAVGSAALMPVATAAAAASSPPTSPLPAASALPLKVAPAASAPVSVATAAVASPAASAVAAATAPGAAASGTIVIRAKGASWVEVTDGKGGVPIRKELQAGEAVGVSGPSPLRVTVGRVDRTEVQVRGKPFDMAPVSKDNVARFTIQ